MANFKIGDQFLDKFTNRVWTVHYIVESHGAYECRSEGLFHTFNANDLARMENVTPVQTTARVTDSYTIPLYGWKSGDTLSIPLPTRYNGTFYDGSVGTKMQKEPKCECGATAIGAPFHSSWCPLQAWEGQK